jgi:hypothetical protein
MDEKELKIKSEKAANEIYVKLRGLDGNWEHASDEFLPANVCCDFQGNIRFRKLLSGIIESEFKQ